jgi:hypothetical protein
MQRSELFDRCSMVDINMLKTVLPLLAKASHVIIDAEYPLLSLTPTSTITLICFHAGLQYVLSGIRDKGGRSPAEYYKRAAKARRHSRQPVTTGSDSEVASRVLDGRYD